MAALIARRCYLLCRRAGEHVISPHEHMRDVVMRGANNALQQTAGYGTRRTDTTQNKNRINKAGELLVTSELSRSQQRNLSDCVQKIAAILAEASERPRDPTAEDVALREARLKKGNAERLKQKKINAAMKRSRRVEFD
ncbi:Peptidyl-tRNA hydrolase ICT1, mitochondrial [Liparis tanakae]|uniref:Peptidyl-tRNA hydrolase ICT1, mitochondrial n=1 Tax=Liparis tanakae TaxID=230148 RepID=A0A4Z2G536_9TELE|nr:Peptidyl-tRNA hydrolase ICT1, mitochondrial [Liparis tanakae]